MNKVLINKILLIILSSIQLYGKSNGDLGCFGDLSEFPDNTCFIYNKATGSCIATLEDVKEDICIFDRKGSITGDCNNAYESLVNDIMFRYFLQNNYRNNIPSHNTHNTSKEIFIKNYCDLQIKKVISKSTIDSICENDFCNGQYDAEVIVIRSKDSLQLLSIINNTPVDTINDVCKTGKCLIPAMIQYQLDSLATNKKKVYTIDNDGVFNVLYLLSGDSIKVTIDINNNQYANTILRKAYSPLITSNYLNQYINENDSLISTTKVFNIWNTDSITDTLKTIPLVVDENYLVFNKIMSSSMLDTLVPGKLVPFNTFSLRGFIEFIGIQKNEYTYSDLKDIALEKYSEKIYKASLVLSADSLYKLNELNVEFATLNNDSLRSSVIGHYNKWKEGYGVIDFVPNNGK